MKSVLLLTLLLNAVRLPAQQPAYGAIVPVAVPIMESTFRQYQEVAHYIVTNRLMLEKLYAAQRRALPAWVPADVWQESLKAAEEVDVTSRHSHYRSTNGTFQRRRAAMRS